jgi:threonine dehydrogenase-like Zn-dependent dehydrogenase
MISAKKAINGVGGSQIDRGNTSLCGSNMCAKWVKVFGFDPELFTRNIASCAKVEGEKVSFSGWRFDDKKSILADQMEFHPDVQNVDRSALFWKALTIKTGQTHMQKYFGPLMGRIAEGEIDPSFIITDRVSLDGGPEAYKKFRDKKDGCINVVMHRHGGGT